MSLVFIVLLWFCMQIYMCLYSWSWWWQYNTFSDRFYSWLSLVLPEIISLNANIYLSIYLILFVHIPFSFSLSFYICLSNFIHHPHHHHVRLARISQTLSLHVSLSFISFGRSSGLHPVPSHSCCMNVWAGRPAFDWPYAGVHRSTSLTISSLLLQQCLACLVRLACIVSVIGGRWPYSWRRVGCCCQDLFNIARNILV